MGVFQAVIPSEELPARLAGAEPKITAYENESLQRMMPMHCIWACRGKSSEAAREDRHQKTADGF
jgi:hypothetical protein